MTSGGMQLLRVVDYAKKCPVRVRGENRESQRLWSWLIFGSSKIFLG